MLRFRQFLSENIRVIEYNGHPHVPDGHKVGVVSGSSATPKAVKGLLDTADKKGYGAESGEVRWIAHLNHKTKGTSFHVWRSEHTTHDDVYSKIHGPIGGADYIRMSDKDKTYASGSFIRNPDAESDDHWHIGIRQNHGRDFVKNHPAFESLLNHEGEPRPIERFDT